MVRMKNKDQKLLFDINELWSLFFFSFVLFNIKPYLLYWKLQRLLSLMISEFHKAHIKVSLQNTSSCLCVFFFSRLNILTMMMCINLQRITTSCCLCFKVGLNELTRSSLRIPACWCDTSTLKSTGAHVAGKMLVLTLSCRVLVIFMSPSGLQSSGRCWFAHDYNNHCLV